MGFITGEIVIGDGLSKPASTPAQSVRDQFGKAETPRAKVVVQKISKAHGMLDTQTVRVDGELMELDKAIAAGHITRAEYYKRSTAKLLSDGSLSWASDRWDEKPKRRAAQNALNEGRTGEAQGHLANLAHMQRPPRPKIKKPAYVPPDITDKGQESAIAAKKAEEEEKKASKKVEFDRIKERLDFQYGRWKEKKAVYEKLEKQRQDYLNRRTKCGLSYGGHYAHTDACMVELPKLKAVFMDNSALRKQAFNNMSNARQGVSREISRLGQPDMKEFGDSAHWRTLYPLV